MNHHVNEDRLRTDIGRNAEFGAVDAPEGRGRTVRAGTDANRRARDYLVERLNDAGLDVRVDAVGNVAGRWSSPGTEDAAPVAAGSHLDSVPEGGIFDGPLGVYAALEAVRAMRDAVVDRAKTGLARLERERGVKTSVERPFDLAPTPMADQCREALRAAGEDAAIETLDMHSGAAHDTMHVADATDAGTLFAPSRDGISHNPREWTDWDDCSAATSVLAGALARLADV
jgi:acetylornithine deacetylase/succinyl-diaminopimelate desuccinylase-like protein